MTRFIGRSAWLVAVALASCAHKQSTAQHAPSPAEQSQTAYQAAAKDQQALAQEQQRLEATTKDVATKQQQLAQAQAQEDQERARMQQLQQAVSQDVQQANQRALEAELAAEQAQGLQGINGRVVHASPSRVLLQAQDGRTYAFDVDPRTSVLVGAEKGSIANIQEGADARVAYDPKAKPATALTIQVTPAANPPTPAASPPPPAR